MWTLPLKFGAQKHENSGDRFGKFSDLTAKNVGMEQDIVS